MFEETFKDIKEEMTEEEIREAESSLRDAKEAIESYKDQQSKWETSGFDLLDVNSAARKDIKAIGEEAWRKIQKENVENFIKAYEAAKLRLQISKEKLPKKAA